MHPRLVALAVLAVALAGCDVGTSVAAPSADPAASAPASARAVTGAPASAAPVSQTPAAPTSAPTVAPRTNPPAPPATGPKVTVVPGNSGKLGSTWLFSLSGFPANARVNETITNPAGIPKPALLMTGPDGSASATFQTSVTDQPGVGRYSFRFESGTVSVTTTIDVSGP